MKWLPQASRFSIRLTLVFWWGLFLVIQQAERLFLLPEATRLESPTAEVLIKTLVTGLRADIIVATLAIMISAGCSALLWSLYRGVGRRRIGRERTKPYSSLLFSVCAVVGLGLSLVLVLDMAYYGYNHRRLDFVFFEYIGDLFGNDRVETSQAALQTQAEMQDAWKWGQRVALFVMAQVAAIVAWWYLFRGVVEPSLGRLKSMVPRHANLLLVVGLMGGIMGFHPYGPWSVQRAGAPLRSRAA